MLSENLYDTTLTCSMIVDPPHVNPCVLSEGFACKQPGFDVEILQYIAYSTRMNIRYVVPDVKQSRNGAWNATVTQLLHSAADFSCNSFSFTGAKNQLVDFVYPIKHQKQGFLIKNPGSSGAIFEASKVITWQLGLLLFVTFMLFFVFALADREIRKQKDAHHHAPSTGLMFYVFVTGGANDDTDESCGLRLFTAITLLMFGIIYTYFFTYFLEASYVVESVVPFRNAAELADLIMKDNYRIIADTESLPDVYDNSEVYGFALLNSALQTHPPIIVDDRSKIVDIIYEQSLNLVYSNKLEILRQMVNNRCDKFLIIEDESSYVTNASFVVPKGFRSKNAISLVLMNLQDFAMNTLTRRYFPQLPCDTLETSDFSITETIAYKASYAFLVCAGCAIGVFAIEYFFYRRINKIIDVVEEKEEKFLHDHGLPSFHQHANTSSVLYA